MRPCLDCGTVCDGTRCPEHARAYKNTRQRIYRARGQSLGPGGSTRAWRKTRAEQLIREPFCRVCRAEGRVTAAVEVDHIIPRIDGGTDEAGNLRSVCRDHNPRARRQPRPSVRVPHVEVKRGPFLA